VAVHAIGQVVETAGVEVRDGAGRLLNGRWSGFDHFQTPEGTQP
jgi:hypothetical protein